LDNLKQIAALNCYRDLFKRHAPLLNELFILVGIPSEWLRHLRTLADCVPFVFIVFIAAEWATVAICDA
jgi:hypothetical protein